VAARTVQDIANTPQGVPRLLSQNYAYDGYHFPKGAVVHILDIALAQDPDRYENPEVYNPDRWLNPSSPLFRAPLTEHPRLKGHHIFGRAHVPRSGLDRGGVSGDVWEFAQVLHAESGRG
jgi:cytochrome P450